MQRKSGDEAVKFKVLRAGETGAALGSFTN
jgi:hypothetical protein